MQVKPEYAALDEYSNIASQLVSRFPEIYGTLDAAKIKCVAITNKERSDKKKPWEVMAVKSPIRMDCAYAYYIIVYMADWSAMDEEHKIALVAESLQAIPTDEDSEGKVNPPDLKAFGVMVRTLGVDYMDKAKIPNLLKDEIKWVLK